MNNNRWNNAKNQYRDVPKLKRSDLDAAKGIFGWGIIIAVFIVIILAFYIIVTYPKPARHGGMQHQYPSDYQSSILIEGQKELLL